MKRNKTATAKEFEKVIKRGLKLSEINVLKK